MRSNRRLHYFWDRLKEVSNHFLLNLITVVSFLMIVFSLGYIIYNFILFNVAKVLVGCVVLCVMIHLNKSLS